MIAQNLAIGLIEPFAATSWCHNGVVTRRFVPQIEYSYVVASPEDQPMSRMARDFIQILQAHMSEFEEDSPVAVEPTEPTGP